MGMDSRLYPLIVIYVCKDLYSLFNYIFRPTYTDKHIKVSVYLFSTKTRLSSKD